MPSKVAQDYELQFNIWFVSKLDLRYGLMRLFTPRSPTIKMNGNELSFGKQNSDTTLDEFKTFNVPKKELILNCIVPLSYDKWLEQLKNIGLFHGGI